MLPRATFTVLHSRPWIHAARASGHRLSHGTERSLQALRSYSDSTASGSDKPVGSAESKRTAGSKADAPSLDSLFDMLDLPETPQAPPRISRTTEPANDEFDLDDIFKLIDSNKATTEKSAENQSRAPPKSERSPQQSDHAYDPMAEFERILSDLASNDTEVYKRERPAPRFWDETSGQLSRSQDSKINKALDPEGLFKEGPLASMFSARKLTSNPKSISPLAKRIQRADRIAKERGLLKPAGTTGQTSMGATDTMAVESGKEGEAEHILLARLAQCQTVTSLAAVVTELLASQGTAEPVARPSAAVIAEAIKMSREMQASPMAYYIYNQCRAQMSLVDKLRVLDSCVFEEMLLTAWAARRDISTVMLVMQDLVAMGVTGQDGLRRQVDAI
ncbi:hypothetical protein FBU59_005050, partial [Linderina macrospora]